MLEVETLADLQPYVGQNLGTSEWTRIDQALIDAQNAFAEDNEEPRSDTAPTPTQKPTQKKQSKK